MNSKNHSLILAFVSLTILVTIAVQVYWNYLSYQTNKEELIYQVQISLDQAVDTYYADIAQNHTLTVTSTDSLDEIPQLKHLIEQSKRLMNDTTQSANTFKLKTKISGHGHDSLFTINERAWNGATAISIEDDREIHFKGIDSTTINLFATKIYISMQNDLLDFDQLAISIKSDFDIKNWPIAFGLLLRAVNCEANEMPCDTLETFGITGQQEQLIAQSRSAFIPDDSTLEIHFSNISSILLKRSLVGISLSLLLSAAIIFCLLYLFKTIKEQKQLAEIKNDLISNITHEFKTPITTIGTALEGIENFNGLGDPEKTKKYIGISNGQLGKLNTMVEKLLETASIDSEHLRLNLEQVDLIQLIEQQLAKYRLSNEGISFTFENDQAPAICSVDKFHIESAIGNLIDNAIKYGQGEVAVLLKKQKETVLIQVKDNGMAIAKDQRTRIFDKFYRIPTGNVHDVKGFGIGLYYAKNIVEKHGGKLTLDANASMTTFNIALNHAD